MREGVRKRGTEGEERERRRKEGSRTEGGVLERGKKGGRKEGREWLRVLCMGY